ncbi:helix-turn-helix transcriptional regulator [Myceligenerans pegani]|uniref:Helix-turn-helix transcriptional regulator n=1 Tax=Myceligenerans pegani TaxID=2776917 RepID=A0ABR9MTT1_9MICO|nr:helix-turn-helix transcriptional regulator [Myceligenerans sp. TRM 65318]MBE1874481.1 helix-turn-helix transcriptional regulator [Myceligenerans sp. TRM 65318]MBE3016752.1 helix-turn-helix transcriptional regulator [Myceligenerans sp. TRM 65318]
MRSTGTNRTPRIVDRLPQRLEELIGESVARAVIIVVDAGTAAELGLVTPSSAAGTGDSSRAGRRPGLARRRYEMGLTQEGLAREIGVQPSTVGRWERGVTAPSLWARAPLCRALDVPRTELDVLLGEGGAAEPTRLLHVVETPDDGTDDAMPAVGIA